MMTGWKSTSKGNVVPELFLPTPFSSIPNVCPHQMMNNIHVVYSVQYQSLQFQVKDLGVIILSSLTQIYTGVWLQLVFYLTTEILQWSLLYGSFTVLRETYLFSKAKNLEKYINKNEAFGF